MTGSSLCANELLLKHFWAWWVVEMFLGRSCSFVQRWYLLMMGIIVKADGSQHGLKLDKWRSIICRVWSSRLLVRSVQSVVVDWHCNDCSLLTSHDYLTEFVWFKDLLKHSMMLSMSCSVVCLLLHSNVSVVREIRPHHSKTTSHKNAWKYALMMILLVKGRTHGPRKRVVQCVDDVWRHAM